MAANNKTGNNRPSPARNHEQGIGNEDLTDRSRNITGKREKANEIQQMKRPPKPKR